MHIIKVKSATSTNDLLKDLAKQQTQEEGLVVFAENQTDGKGQRGNSWESEPGKNIACSLLLYPTFLPLNQHFLLSEVVALGIKSALDSYIQPVEIKWPNDIYYGNKKLCGVLIENELLGAQFSQSIIGIGLNVNQEVFLSDAPNPVSMKQILGKEVSIESVLEETIQAVLAWYEKLRNGETETIARSYQNALYRKSGFHDYEDSHGTFTARIDRIGDDGFLHLITREGEKRSYAFKEIVFR
ncbi:MAG: biotin--[acetyl-CoA-carboxylase] ligase [Candidatus Symbiothrix sp.]|jgi:BirA family biotin operon repressor/biotin-[acetyl-CoA-carboxylase] ligase|nr:biotin--[acetyl-CoA-carboxylase] ligase [Candidatus Symbiothrix sp.]